MKTNRFSNQFPSPFPHSARRLLLYCLLALLIFLPATSALAQSDQSPQDSVSQDSAPTSTQPVRKIFGDSRDKVDVTVAPGKYKVHPGDHFPIAVIFNHQPGWHIHTNNPIVPPELGEASFYIKTQILSTPSPDASAPDPIQLHLDQIQWPKVHNIRVAFGQTPVDYGVFADRAIAYVPATAGSTLGTYTVELRATFQSCDERSCLRPVRKMKLTFEVEVVPPNVPIVSDQDVVAKPDFKEFDTNVWTKLQTDPVHTPAPGPDTSPTTSPSTQRPETSTPTSPTTQSTDGSTNSTPPSASIAFKFFGLDFSIDPRTSGGYIGVLIVALIGGFLLNLTPCVLPVIPIKIMGLSKSAGNPRRTLALGATMAVGVVGFWVLLGLLVSTLGFFKSTNQLFQYPAFTISIGVVIGIMAVGMCGLFSFQLPNWIYSVEFKQDSYPGSLGYGVMTAILSTPCTAPLMGAAAAWAATQNPVTTLTTFAFIGIGMASPYLFLAAFPNLVSKMPRTGPASDLIKQVMGILMLAAGAYFIGTGISGLLTHPGDAPMTSYWWIVGGIIGAAGAWLGYRTLKITPSPVRRTIFVSLGILAIVAGLVMAQHLTAPGPTRWIYFTPQTLDAARHNKRIIVMEFTAEWCINCKVLEATVLNDPRVVAAMRQPGITPMKVDLTNSEDGNKQLENAGSLTIPYLVIFDRAGRAVFKSDAYTPEQIIEGIKKAQK